MRLRGTRGAQTSAGGSLTEVEAGKVAGAFGGGAQVLAGLRAPAAFGWVWVPALPLPTCMTWAKSPNLSVPQILIGRMGARITHTESGCFEG